jgi:hypothetical protein
VLMPVAVSDLSVIDLCAADAVPATMRTVIAARAFRPMRPKTPPGVYFFQRRCHSERRPTLNASKPTGANERTVSSTGIPATCANTKGTAIMTAFQLGTNRSA